MKELSTEEKAKRYDKALEIIIDYYQKIKYSSLSNASTDREVLEKAFPQLKESEDEKAIRDIKVVLESSATKFFKEEGKMPIWYDRAIAWLEKQVSSYTKKDIDDAYLKGVLDTKHKLENQSEQKPLFKKGDTVFWDGEEFNILDITKDSYNVGGYIIPIYRQNELLLKQKPAEKTEPKFHEGEWITNGDYTWKIVEVKHLDYILQSQDGNIVDDTISHVDEQFHSFTIEDAKDGDVLTCYSDIKGQPIEQTGIIKQYVGRHGGCSNSFKAHFGVDWDNNVVIEGYMGSSNIYPATKEQRDTLFTKMKEVGYEWDGNKKELKMIVVPIFNIGDTIVKKHNSDIHDFGSFTITDITDGKYWYNDRIICDITKQDEWEIEKQGEQKPADKVEPKFKVGDWLTSYQYGNVVRVLEALEDNYKLEYNGNTIVMLCTELVNSDYRLWDISKDAKNGDVLASSRSIFIFSQEYIAGKPEAHCGIMNDLFIVKPESCWTNEKCYPATKEQRDTLLKAMADAGYTFDFNKKELKKIENKNPMLSNFFKAVYEREKADAQNPPKWSEEDEENINWFDKFFRAESVIAEGKDIPQDRYLWFKNLKDRVHPQIHWKPSDEQMEALEGVVQGSVFRLGILESLYQDLKKLREE